ncbi:MAG: cell division protein FtsZ [Treponema sp.]|nr:cell division protein FtsZ [Treponema sp.]
MIELSVDDTVSAVNPTVIKIIGCGGGGSNAVNRMIEAGVNDVEFVVMNTDLQALGVSKAQKRLSIGQKLTGGLGAGGNPEVGENAAKEDAERISNIVKGADMVVITAGMGGGTGTGSAPVVAELAKKEGALTIAVVTTPFGFEGPVRMRNAQDGLKKLRGNVDSLIVVPNQQIMKIVDKKVNFKQAFRLADDVLCQGVQGISEIITLPGDINVDFADVKSVMQGQGDAILGVGFGEGENRAVDAAQAAISNPLLEDCQIDGASNILVNVVGDDDEASMPTMMELEEITKTISASASKNVNIISGICTKHGMGDKLSVTVIATGFAGKGGNSAQTEDGSEAEKFEKRGSENVLDYGIFENILHGGPSQAAPSVKLDPSKIKVSTIPLKPSSLETLDAQASPKPAAVTPSPALAASSAAKLREPAAAGSQARPNILSASVQQEGEPVRRSSQGGIRPPAGYTINQDDLSQPACWRHNLDGLSKSINLVDVK